VDKSDNAEAERDTASRIRNGVQFRARPLHPAQRIPDPRARAFTWAHRGFTTTGCLGEPLTARETSGTGRISGVSTGFAVRPPAARTLPFPPQVRPRRRWPEGGPV